LFEEFPGKVRDAFEQKREAKGGWTAEAEVQALNRGIKAGRLLDDKGKPVRDYDEKTYLRERREMQRYAKENPHLGLDE
jgi:hypothetical protein